MGKAALALSRRVATSIGVVVIVLGAIGPGAGRARSEEFPAGTRGYRSFASDPDPSHSGRHVGTVTFGTNLPAAEPTLGVTRDGSVFLAAWGDEKIDVLRSRDGARAWDVVSPKISADENWHVISLDPYIYVDPTTSRIFTVDLTVACSILSFSDDDGESWVTDPLGCGRPINDHQTLFAGPPVASPTVGYPNVLYYCWNDVLSSSCAKSLNGGLTFSSTGAPAFIGLDESGQAGPKQCGGLHGHGTADGEGRIYLPREFCGRAMVAISGDEGATWEQVEVAPAALAGVDPSIAVDAEGNLYYVWLSTDRLPYLATSVDGGRSWSAPLRITGPEVTEANLPSIAVGKGGSVAIVLMGSENSGFRCSRRGSCLEAPYSDVSWNGYMAFSDNALARRPSFESVRINPATDPLKWGRCGPGRCGEVYDFLDVAIDGEGRAYGAFVDLTMGVIPIQRVGLVARSISAPRS